MNTPCAVVCNDSATLALLLTRQLEALGYRVRSITPDQLLLPLAEPPDLCCIELLGNYSNGFKLLRQLRRHHDCRCVLLSASARRTDVAWGRAAGAHAVLLRPFTVEQLAHSAVGEAS